MLYWKKDTDCAAHRPCSLTCVALRSIEIYFCIFLCKLLVVVKRENAVWMRVNRCQEQWWLLSKSQIILAVTCRLKFHPGRHGGLMKALINITAFIALSLTDIKTTVLQNTDTPWTDNHVLPHDSSHACTQLCQITCFQSHDSCSVRFSKSQTGLWQQKVTTESEKEYSSFVLYVQQSSRTTSCCLSKLWVHEK